MPNVDNYEWELYEANLELERHHSDFARISKIVDRALTWDSMTGWALNHKDALIAIRGIVG